MSNHETLTAALLAAFNLDADMADPAAVAGAAATVLLAFADAVRGPAPVAGELVSPQPVAPASQADQAELLNELRALIHELRTDRTGEGKGVLLAHRLETGCLCGLPG